MMIFFFCRFQSCCILELLAVWFGSWFHNWNLEYHLVITNSIGIIALRHRPSCYRRRRRLYSTNQNKSLKHANFDQALSVRCYTAKHPCFGCSTLPTASQWLFIPLWSLIEYCLIFFPSSSSSILSSRHSRLEYFQLIDFLVSDFSFRRKKNSLNVLAAPPTRQHLSCTVFRK